MAVGATSADPQQWFLCRAGMRLLALPLSCVVETMRALPLEQLAEAGGFIGGVSIIRGAPAPVVDAGALFGEAPMMRRRLVAIDAGGRLVALAVDDVLGVRAIEPDLLEGLPPLLHGAAGDVVSAIGILDGEFLLRLEAGRLVPETALAGPNATGSAP
ncbi:MAG TPA: chemotaxis protein CheW [Stellaceae bacterium]|nr:chemotaxis protein CheW [Stellaceae bacterium]